MDATTISMLIGFLAVIGSQIRQTTSINKRLDDVNRRFEESNRDTNRRLDDMNHDTNRRLDNINARLDRQTEQIGELRERMAKSWKAPWRWSSTETGTKTPRDGAEGTHLVRSPRRSDAWPRNRRRRRSRRRRRPETPP